MEAIAARGITTPVGSFATVKRQGGSRARTQFVALPVKSHSHFQVSASAKVAQTTQTAAAAATMGGPRTTGLIEPDGGVLVDLHVPESERESKRAEAATLPEIQLSKVDLEWVHTVAEGWASPLTGFMRQNEYLQALHFNCLRLPDGTFTNMSLPIVLAIDGEQKEKLSVVNAVSLISPDGNAVAILRK